MLKAGYCGCSPTTDSELCLVPALTTVTRQVWCVPRHLFFPNNPARGPAAVTGQRRTASVWAHWALLEAFLCVYKAIASLLWGYSLSVNLVSTLGEIPSINLLLGRFL